MEQDWLGLIAPISHRANRSRGHVRRLVSEGRAESPDELFCGGLTLRTESRILRHPAQNRCQFVRIMRMRTACQLDEIQVVTRRLLVGAEDHDRFSLHQGVASEPARPHHDDVCCCKRFIMEALLFSTKETVGWRAIIV